MFRSPSRAGLPPLRLLIGDLPATHRQIATHLDIAPRTLERYITADQAPRPVMLSLFWETRWGRSAADCEAANYGAMQAGHAHALARENAQLRKRINQLELLLDTPHAGAANRPFFYTA